MVEKILHEIPRVGAYLDDLIVTGENDEEHLQNLEDVFSRMKEHGLQLKRSKCSFMK